VAPVDIHDVEAADLFLILPFVGLKADPEAVG
jgi:hypothetical protein